MKILSALFSAALCLVSSASAQTFDWNGDPLSAVKIKTVAFRGWLPEQPGPLRGTLVLIPGRHQDGRAMAGDPRWQKLASEIGFAVLACQFAEGDPGEYQSDARGEVARCINQAVDRLAGESNRPELKKAGLAFWGVSAGSNVSVQYCRFFPKRVVALASSTGTWGSGDFTPGKAEIPMFWR